MKTHWFSVLSIAGIVLLAGNVFGNELRWGKPANSQPAAPPAIYIPTVISTDNLVEPPAILQVRQVESISQPRLAPQPDYDYSELRAPNPPVPPGATHQSTPQRTQTLSKTGTGEPCNLQLKSIRDISHDIRPTPGALPEECVMNSTPYDGRHFGRTCFMWKASALSTQAAYFEDVQLERYGNTIVCPALQPVVSGVKFFGTIPILPYKMGVTPPNECVYTLGHRRPGNCAPYMVEPFPISPRGALFQAGAIAGGIYAIP